ACSLSAVAPRPVAGPLALRAWPNPFNPRTTVAFELPVAGPARVELFDLRGRLVRRLLDGTFAAGPRAVAWDATDDAGRRVASGVYLVRVQAGGTADLRKLVLAK
ncbi:MAG: T9SS type A sorting domain-containing protein, partial [Krumholzibacteria bacterium]|nr:T9SS type A sorting domain-containing protein [Candidatus Krumholzibacteria bacterium]